MHSTAQGSQGASEKILVWKILDSWVNVVFQEARGILFLLGDVGLFSNIVS